MAHVTYPAVFYDEAAGTYVCEMKDKKTGRVWGTGYGENRQTAIYDARHAQPENSKIKEAIGWVQRHPFIGGAGVGVALMKREERRFGSRFDLIDYLIGTTFCGIVGWLLSKVFKMPSLQ